MPGVVRLQAHRAAAASWGDTQIIPDMFRMERYKTPVSHGVINKLYHSNADVGMECSGTRWTGLCVSATRTRERSRTALDAQTLDDPQPKIVLALWAHAPAPVPVFRRRAPRPNQTRPAHMTSYMRHVSAQSALNREVMGSLLPSSQHRHRLCEREHDARGEARERDVVVQRPRDGHWFANVSVSGVCGGLNPYRDEGDEGDRASQQLRTTLALLQTLHAHTSFQPATLASFVFQPQPGGASSSANFMNGHAAAPGATLYLTPKDMVQFELRPLSTLHERRAVPGVDCAGVRGGHDSRSAAQLARFGGGAIGSMANLLRDAKSGNAWTQHELSAYKIEVEAVSELLFFGKDLTNQTGLPIDSAILGNPKRFDSNQISQVAAEYLAYYLPLALRNSSHECHVDDVVRETLKLTLYKNPHNFIATGRITPLIICGDSSKVAQTDVAVVHQQTLMLLIVVEDKLWTKNPILSHR
ncbi:hypothetical protein H0H92_014865 [Tricholoma furcatifolium]|nr:hypothetical protein H0H92_014865 [Tricholoma furcatifolium]